MAASTAGHSCLYSFSRSALPLRAADVERFEVEVLGLLGHDCDARGLRPAALPSSSVSFVFSTSSIFSDQLAEGGGDPLVALGLGLLQRLSRTPSAPLRERLMRRENFCVSMTMPSTPEGTSSESFFTSSPARPKMACSSFSSGVSSVLRLGRDLADQDVARPDVGADADDAASRRGCAAPSR